MPDLETQVQIPGAFTADFTVVRALVGRSRTYEESAKMFKPFRATKETNPGTRDALGRIAERARRLGEPAFMFVENRIERDALSTMAAVVSTLAV